MMQLVQDMTCEKMNAVAWMFLLLLVAGFAYLFASRIGAQAGRRAHMNQHGTTSVSFSGTNKPPLRVYKYHAVELQICDDPCESALAIAGKRLLKSEAPALPLGGCPHKKCTCNYTQYDDRRILQRRCESYPYGMPIDGRMKEERRKANRRRSG